ncbi:type II and III secretion system protein family protein [Amylibacter sp. SFDW26]|uniref:type II and III secretion system protein family protein n=1 Tax=Amylibacter sp. SFDW26 TaxID=2652722 RepID=UPI0012614C15|nr:type II and III secretion system protein family protein [Amylibacter sp. SFDW26]KAB7613474.1 type II and III secretion system protein family protein [Amylibacter sp. SFDW26]
MKLVKTLCTVVAGALFSASLPATMSYAQNTLRIMRGTTTSAISVQLNQAIVMESEQSFAELSVANPSIADIATLSDKTIYVLGKSPGKTVMTLLGADGKLITNVNVRVTPDLSEFKQLLKEIMPKENIQVRSANDGIVLSGTVSGPSKIALALDLAQRYAPERVTNLITVGGSQQVLLKVRFAEMQRSVAKTLSSSIGISTSSGGKLNGGLSVGNAIAGSAVANGNGGTGLNNPAASLLDGRNGAVGLGFTSGVLAINLLLEALESKGLIRTLAEPNLVALSGTEANFLGGGEFPIPVSQANNVTTVEFKPFGIEMKFIPTVLSGDLINLVMTTAVSAIDTTNSLVLDGLTIPAFTRREASTSIEMRDGESISIAGLLQEDFRDLSGQVPWLGDVPVLGALFRSAEYERNQTELVIIVTAHLVSPVDGDVLALPTDRVKLPSDNDLFLFGHIEGSGKTRKGGTVASQDFSGSYGYVME